MKQRRWIRFGVLTVLLGIAVACYPAVVWYRWLERADAVTGVAVELGPAYQVIKVGESPDLFFSVVNRGDREVKLVEPGDGSENGRRTPLIEWSYSNEVPRGCGYINTLESKEVFILTESSLKKVTTFV